MNCIEMVLTISEERGYCSSAYKSEGEVPPLGVVSLGWYLKMQDWREYSQGAVAKIHSKLLADSSHWFSKCVPFRFSLLFFL